jgi:hypothetical protein
MKQKLIQIFGIVLTLFYAAFIVWIYATEPRTFKEVATKAEVTTGTYQVDQQKFDAGLKLFREENYRAARDEFNRADSEKRDARTQFYIAYSFYREGWGRFYDDDALFKQGIEAVNRVLAIDANFKSDDADLQMKTPAELKAELEEGTERSVSDLDPRKVVRQRK